MAFALGRLGVVSLAVVMMLGCASGGGGDPEPQAPLLSGTYRVEAQLVYPYPKRTMEIRGTLTILDKNLLTFVRDSKIGDVPKPCRYFNRGSAIVSECDHLDFTFLETEDDRIRVLLQAGAHNQGMGTGYLLRR